MKFLVDAQLPRNVALILQSAGYDTIHTKDLPNRNATTDEEINTISIQESRIVISKDSDFFDSFIISQQPYKLLQVTTGNIKNTELEAIFIKNLPQLIELFQQYSVIEMSRDTIIVHQ
ncbi:hypothetical protein Cylst_5730 [Cylindrospermum stagnale PCC 7417]|uniref:DUF5615 domain-containing protein n=1 Tax=Cylindrospermum stagnale PCC 7417 TaxID=56107 RepID=K9X6M4_9NOST|nr:DUF5615 family PIN-like protein [Cylindrospermum stagnale]AFZ27726.1 hypothetical protein Cylst_5730 [Cylindrospermum stagnale PCC 7417]